MANPDAAPSRPRRKHQYVKKFLGQFEEALSDYMELQTDLSLSVREFSQEEWEHDIRPRLVKVAKVLAGAEISSRETDEFLAWPPTFDETHEVANPNRDNIYLFPKDDPKLRIRVGSIHSVKGETHTATLVLETFFRTHNLASLKPWLLGDRVGGTGASPAMHSRLKQHYVAMTRPTHLLCLALRAEDFNEEQVKKLIGQGWRIACIRKESVDWME